MRVVSITLMTSRQRVGAALICNSDASLSLAFSGREVELQRQVEEAQALAAIRQAALDELAREFNNLEHDLRNLQLSSSSAGTPVSNLPLPCKLARQIL